MSTKDFIPAGFVPLAQWDYRCRDKAAGHSPDYKELRLAADAGKIPAIQIGGSKRWYVREADAIALLELQAIPVQPAPKSKAEPPSGLQYESVCESLGDIAQSLAAVERLLGRLVDAAEHIVTQPKEPTGSWRDMNGEVMN